MIENFSEKEKKSVLQYVKIIAEKHNLDNVTTSRMGVESSLAGASVDELRLIFKLIAAVRK